MKNPLPSMQVSLLLLLCLFTLTLNAQNPTVLSIDFPVAETFMNQATHVEFTVANLSSMPATEVQAQVEVLDPDNQTVFNFPLLIPLIESFQTLSLSTHPAEWLPGVPGSYTIIVTLLYSEDEDPSNNLLTKTINAIPQPPIEIFQMDLVSPLPILNSTYGVFKINSPPVLEPLFVNVMATNPENGEQAWIVQNLPLLPFSDTREINYWFDLRLLGLNEGDDLTQLEFSMRIDPDVQLTSFLPLGWQDILVAPRSYNVASNNYEEVALSPPLTVSQVSFSHGAINAVYRGCTVPNIDLDSTAHPATETYAGDLNACGPAAAANSMQWLENTHPNIPNTGTSLREKMENMSGKMGRTTYMGRDTFGVTTEQLVQGKLAFIDQYKLPIHVKYQSAFVADPFIPSPNPDYGHSAENKGGTSQGIPPTWEFLQSEMEKGEDVEMMFGWYDKQNNRHGGHWVTITGTLKIGPFKGIFIKDDWDQENPGGTEETFLHWVTDSGYPRLVGFDGPNNYNWVESVVSESYDPDVLFLISDFKLEHLVFTDPWITPDSGKCFFSFNFPPSTQANYLNVVAHFFDSGPGPFDSAWIVRNELLPPRDSIQRVSLWWDLTDLGWQPGDVLDSVRIHVGIDPTIAVDSFFDVFYTTNLTIDSVEYTVGNGAFDANPSILPIPTFPDLSFDTLLPTAYVYRGCDMPNVELDSTTNNPNTRPGYAGDKNACGPAAAANSLHWLEKEHPDHIPASGTLREKLEELSGMMKRAPNGGVYRDSFILAKLEFIDKHKLPIHVKFQSWLFGTDDLPSPDTLYGHSAQNKNDSAFAKPQWDWLVQEMENGEDVELEFGYYDKNGKRMGGHWITVTGVVEVGGVTRIYFKDDIDQLKEGGLRHERSDWVLHPSGHSYLKDFSGKKYTCWVESVVSESYDPSVTFCPQNLTLDQDPILSGTYSASNTLYVSGRIPADGNVILSAPNIVLLPGFTVEAGATLSTNATGCP